MLFKMLLCLIVICFSPYALAEEVKIEADQAKSNPKSSEESISRDTAELDEIVVTATRTEKEVETAPGSISVITKEVIEKRNLQTVDRVLNATTGVYNRSFKGIINTEPVVIMRGIPGSTRTLMLMNGIPFNDPYRGYAPLGGLAAEDIERIEVVRGPFSSLYGGHAMSGAINIISRIPEKREFTLKSGYGSSWDRGEGIDDLGKVYVSYGDKIKDKFSLFLSYGYKATNGYPGNLNVQSRQPTNGIDGWSHTRDYLGNPRYLIGDTGDQRWWDDNITLRAGYDLSTDSKISFMFMRTRNEYIYDDPHTYLRNSDGKEIWAYGTVRESTFLSGSGGREQNIYQTSFETKISDLAIKLAVGFSDYDKYWFLTPGSAATRSSGTGRVSNIPSESLNADLQLSLPILGRQILTFGGSFSNGWANAKENGLSDWKDEGSTTALSYQAKGKEKYYAVFFQDEIMILPNLTGYVGLRQDWWETYDGYANQVGTPGYPIEYDSRDSSYFSPKASIVYQPFEQTTVKTSIGKAFRPPTVVELYRTTTSSGITTQANADLDPETIFSWDVGIYQTFFAKGPKVGIVFFENHVDDLISTKTVSASLRERVNIGKALIRGFEVEVEQRLGKEFRLFGNFTYNHAKVKENEAEPESEGKRLTEVPEKMINIGGEYERGPFSSSLIGRYVSKRYRTGTNSDKTNNVYGSRDPFFVADAKISYALTKWASLSLSVDNIFNRRYFDFYKTPGSSWFSELTMRF